MHEFAHDPPTNCLTYNRPTHLFQPYYSFPHFQFTHHYFSYLYFAIFSTNSIPHLCSADYNLAYSRPDFLSYNTFTHNSLADDGSNHSFAHDSIPNYRVSHHSHPHHFAPNHQSACCCNPYPPSHHFPYHFDTYTYPLDTATNNTRSSDSHANATNNISYSSDEVSSDTKPSNSQPDPRANHACTY